MTDVGDTDHEYDCGQATGDNDTPDRPLKVATALRDTDKSYCYAAFNEHNAGGVEELGNEEELLMMCQFHCARFSLSRSVGEYAPWFLA